MKFKKLLIVIMLLAVCGLLIGGVSAASTTTKTTKDTWVISKNTNVKDGKNYEIDYGKTSYFKYVAVQKFKSKSNPQPGDLPEKSYLNLTTFKNNKIKVVKIKIFNSKTQKMSIIKVRGNNKNKQTIVLGKNQYFHALYGDSQPVKAYNLVKVKYSTKIITSESVTDIWKDSKATNHQWGKYKWVSTGESQTANYKAWINSKYPLKYGDIQKSYKGYVAVKVNYKTAKIKSISLSLVNEKTGDTYYKTFKGNNKNIQIIKLGELTSVDLFRHQPFNAKVLKVKYVYDPSKG